MITNTAIRNLIREAKTHQIDSMIHSSGKSNMISMDTSILELYHNKIIDAQTAIEHACNPEMMRNRIKD
jgi:twitching motility protein PilT